MAGREQAGASQSGPPCRGNSAQGWGDQTLPLPCSPGPLLFSASCCLLWQPARSRDLTASSLPCPLGPEAQGPGGKEDVADSMVQRRNEAGVEDGKRGDSGLATYPFLPQLPHL